MYFLNKITLPAATNGGRKDDCGKTYPYLKQVVAEIHDHSKFTFRGTPERLKGLCERTLAGSEC